VTDDKAPQLFYNYESAKEWYRSSEPPPLPSNAAADYVIITTSAYVTGSTKLNDFKTHKESLGYAVEIVTETQYSGLTPSEPGSGTAGKIRKWLQNNYISKGIEYVLLIGNPDPDTGDVPMLKCWPRRSYSTYRDAPTDYYFADLTGSWDSDGDTYFGEYPDDSGVDFYAEVFVGRIPIYELDYTTLDSVLQKMIDYDKMRGSRAWRKKLLLPEAISNYYNEDWDPTNYRTCGHPLADWLKNRLPKITTCTLYEKAGLDACTAACNANLTRANVRSRWANGFGMVVWWGHGDDTAAWRKYWSTDDGDGVPEWNEMTWVEFFTSSDASAYLNDNMPSWAYLCSCLNGNPDNTNNLGTALLHHGAIATISASRVSWYCIGWGYFGPFELKGYADNATLGYFMAEKTGALNASFGKGVFGTKQEAGHGFGSASWMNLMDFNLYGDPSQRICATNPNDIAVAQGPGSVSYAKDFSYNGSLLLPLKAFGGANPTGELSIAKGDVTGDGVPEIVVGQRSSGASSWVKVFAEDGTLLRNFKAFGPVNSQGMVNVAVGDVNEDGVGEIVIANGPGGSSWVKVFKFNFGAAPTMLTKFQAFGGGNPSGDVRVAAGNTYVNMGQIITGQGHGGSSLVRVWNWGTPPTLYNSFRAFGAANPSGGVDVGLGNFDNNLTGRQLIAVGQGGPGTTTAAAAGSWVKIFNEDGTRLKSFKAFGPVNAKGRVTVDGGQGDTDPAEEIIVGQGVGGGSWVKVFNYAGTPPTIASKFKAFGAINSQARGTGR